MTYEEEPRPHSADPARPKSGPILIKLRSSRRPDVGQPPLAYLTWWPLGTAARMLRDSDAALSEIAGAVGYGSEFAFANAFKRQYAMAPGKYRRQGCPLPARTPSLR
ncbi:helix-turn-helix domain-containing protein [Nonomuraea sp. NPDC004580]|uniref:helix-turn-helix domain-containing protein n=1 Tax=Nonomuraea sp. NPDC004580 TaxID=3154552 RepID=UPI0033A35585